MCTYIEYGEKYSLCQNESTHVIMKKRYDKCQKARIFATALSSIIGGELRNPVRWKPLGVAFTKSY